MEGNITVKILDNTVISASLKEIKTINLIERCLKRYKLVTSEYVFVETLKGFSNPTIENCYSDIEVHEINEEMFNFLLDYLERRFPYLHRGELSSFLVALLKYAENGKSYYYVTDDRRMRDTISKILNDPIVKSKLKNPITPENFNLTGTIGLLLRLKYRGLISKEEAKKIADDLENSSFRVTPELLKKLRED
ncbi:DUF3368 domain-containing protein [Methanocaldococcus sp. 28A]